MHKIAALLLAGVLASGLASCGGDDGDESAGKSDDEAYCAAVETTAQIDSADDVDAFAEAVADSPAAVADETAALVAALRSWANETLSTAESDVADEARDAMGAYCVAAGLGGDVNRGPVKVGCLSPAGRGC